MSATDGRPITRREALRRGSLGAATMALAGASPVSRPRADAVILILMVGGPSQLETFDPKPEAPTEVRGDGRSIATAVPGVRLGEGLPRLARRLDRVALIRSLHHDAAPIHETGLQLIQTGSLAPLDPPAPPHVGTLAGSFMILPHPIGHTGVRISRGQERSAGFQPAPPASKLPPTFAQSCRQARDLVAAGTRFVVVNQFATVFNAPSWDAHGRDPFTTLDEISRSVMPAFDQAVSDLLDDLAADGLLDRTLVVAAGEFGRTPRLNASGGRDHWLRAFSALVAGAGVPGGAVLGATDPTAGEVASDPVPLADLAAFMGRALGLPMPPLDSPLSQLT